MGIGFASFPWTQGLGFCHGLCLCQQYTFTRNFIQLGLLPLLTTMFAKFLWTRESIVMKRMDSRAKPPSFKFWPWCLISCVALNKALNFSASLLTPSKCHLDINCNYDFNSVCEDRDRQVLSRYSVVRVSQKPTTETTTWSLTGPWGWKGAWVSLGLVMPPLTWVGSGQTWKFLTWIQGWSPNCWPDSGF